jgi:hypothetical protein
MSGQKLAGYARHVSRISKIETRLCTFGKARFSFMSPVNDPFRVRDASGTRGSMGLGRHEVASAANEYRTVLIHSFMASPKRKNEPTFLKRWQQIASFLGQPLAVVQRWAKSGMPVVRQGRHMIASPGELSRWLAASGVQSIHAVSENVDLTTDLRRALSEIRRKGNTHRTK